MEDNNNDEKKPKKESQTPYQMLAKHLFNKEVADPYKIESYKIDPTKSLASQVPENDTALQMGIGSLKLSKGIPSIKDPIRALKAETAMEVLNPSELPSKGVSKLAELFRSGKIDKANPMVQEFIQKLMKSQKP